MIDLRSVSSSYVSTLLAAFEGMGMDTASVLARTSIDTAMLGDAHYRISACDEISVWRAALELGADPSIGLRMARELRPASFRLVGIAALGCQSVGDALQLILRYQGVVSDIANLAMVSQSDDILRLEYQSGDDLLPQQKEALLGGLYLQAAWLTSSRLELESASFRHTALASPSEYRAVFGVGPAFSAEHDAIYLRKDQLSLDLSPTVDHALQSHAIDLLDHQLALLPSGPSLLTTLRYWLISRIAAEISIHDAASALDVSPRTLQRNLSDAGTTWSGLVDELRKERAAALVSADLAVEVVATRLGYHDASSFTRAFRRWFGAAPGEWRRRSSRP